MGLRILIILCLFLALAQFEPEAVVTKVSTEPGCCIRQLDLWSTDQYSGLPQTFENGTITGRIGNPGPNASAAVFVGGNLTVKPITTLPAPPHGGTTSYTLTFELRCMVNGTWVSSGRPSTVVTPGLGDATWLFSDNQGNPNQVAVLWAQIWNSMPAATTVFAELGVTVRSNGQCNCTSTFAFPCVLVSGAWFRHISAVAAPAQPTVVPYGNFCTVTVTWNPVDWGGNIQYTCNPDPVTARVAPVTAPPFANGSPAVGTYVNNQHIGDPQLSLRFFVMISDNSGYSSCYSNTILLQ